MTTDNQNSPVAPQGERQWICPTRTVADLVNNLLTMDQAMPVYGAQYIERDGRRCAIAVPPTVSRERVKDGRWIGRGEELNAAVVWTRAEQPAAVAGPADEGKALDLLALLFDAWENGDPCHSEDGTSLGNAFRLDNATFHACADLLNRRRPVDSRPAAPALEAPAAPAKAAADIAAGLGSEPAKADPMREMLVRKARYWDVLQFAVLNRGIQARVFDGAPKRAPRAQFVWEVTFGNTTLNRRSLEFALWAAIKLEYEGKAIPGNLQFDLPDSTASVLVQSTQLATAPQAPAAPSASLETVQWRNIHKVVKALADFSFGGPNDPQWGVAHICMTQGLTAKDGLDILSLDLEPLASAQAAPAATAVDAELLELAQAIVKFKREHGSVLAVHIDNLADLVAERATKAAP